MKTAAESKLLSVTEAAYEGDKCWIINPIIYVMYSAKLKR